MSEPRSSSADNLPFIVRHLLSTRPPHISLFEIEENIFLFTNQILYVGVLSSYRWQPRDELNNRCRVLGVRKIVGSMLLKWRGPNALSVIVF